MELVLFYSQSWCPSSTFHQIGEQPKQKLSRKVNASILKLHKLWSWKQTSPNNLREKEHFFNSKIKYLIRSPGNLMQGTRWAPSKFKPGSTRDVLITFSFLNDNKNPKLVIKLYQLVEQWKALTRETNKSSSEEESLITIGLPFQKLSPRLAPAQIACFSFLTRRYLV